MAARAAYDTGERGWGSHDGEERYDAPDEYGDHQYTDTMADDNLDFGDNTARPSESLYAHYEESTGMTDTSTNRAQLNTGLEPADLMDDAQDNNYTHGSNWGGGGGGSVSGTHGEGPRAIPSWSAEQTYSYDDGRGHHQPRRRHQERRRPQKKHGPRAGGSTQNPRHESGYGMRNTGADGNPDYYSEQAMAPLESSQPWGESLACTKKGL
ncbi:hypothetical protein F503_07469 [Ophiostoma piceae UAMH 11346]|uniref:Uncharacterized protein n=1 Tax=Ophiostoma piceae (strain UAMH 11346) TaxID=1262450 RepID=S3CSU2_OPHP1|nr:hypothetical protein F503_07469 [Ophiostoma piceae UAMH 11346]